MKNLYTKNEFLSINNDDEMINEGFISKMFKGLWKGVMQLAKRIKGSNEIKKIYDKYKKLLDETFSKLSSVGVSGEVSAKTESIVLEDLEQENPAQEQETPEEKNLVNLSPDKIKQLTKITNDRIKELRKKFDGEVNVIVNKLSKNPEYSSDKLKQFAIVMKNQFNSYMFDQWYGFYQKAGDQDKIIKLTKVKKENDLRYKQSVQDLNTKLGEKQQEVDVVKGGIYNYFSETNNREDVATVIGTALGRNEKGERDVNNTEHDKMWKVKKDDNVFWISTKAFKSVVSDPSLEKDIKKI